MHVFNRQRNLFPHVLQVCKSFLRCIDVIEIFKFRLLFMGPASQRHWRADPTLETWTHGTQYPSSTRLQTFNGTKYWIQHTHPGWIQTWSTGYLQYRSLAANSIHDCKMTLDVSHQMYSAVDQHHRHRPTLRQMTDILREDPPDSSSNRGSSATETGRGVLEQLMTTSG